MPSQHTTTSTNAKKKKGWKYSNEEYGWADRYLFPVFIAQLFWVRPLRSCCGGDRNRFCCEPVNITIYENTHPQMAQYVAAIALAV